MFQQDFFRTVRPVSIPCSNCGKPLTDPKSRARGKGPVCAGESRYIGAPYSNSTTSKEAAQTIAPALANLCRLVYRHIQETGGATCEEVEFALELKHQTASARVYELRERHMILDSGITRLTSSGRKAIVWRANHELFY